MEMKHILHIKLTLLLFALMGCTTLAQSDSLAPLNRIFLPPHYKADAIEGWVVDAETKEPIEEAIVIALWELERPYSMEGPIPSGHMQVTEVLTDAQGHYRIPAWGPTKRPGDAYMNGNDPLIIVFKSDYDYLNLTNLHGHSPETEDKREEVVHNSVWNGKTVELEKFKGDLEKYSDRIWRMSAVGLDALFNRTFGAGDCDWQKIPDMVIVLDKYKKIFREKKFAHVGIPSLDQLIKRKQCNVSTKQEFIEEYQ